jgi:hypothetical protein
VSFAIIRENFAAIGATAQALKSSRAIRRESGRSGEKFGKTCESLTEIDIAGGDGTIGGDISPVMFEFWKACTGCTNSLNASFAKYQRRHKMAALCLGPIVVSTQRNLSSLHLQALFWISRNASLGFFLLSSLCVSF